MTRSRYLSVPHVIRNEIPCARVLGASSRITHILLLFHDLLLDLYRSPSSALSPKFISPSLCQSAGHLPTHVCRSFSTSRVFHIEGRYWGVYIETCYWGRLCIVGIKVPTYNTTGRNMLHGSTFGISSWSRVRDT